MPSSQSPLINCLQRPLTGIGGRCLDVSGVNPNNGAKVEIWDCWGGANQKWSLSGSSNPPPPPSNAINVHDYGAHGDGSNATGAIQAAVNAASGGATIYFPAGTYTISQTINLKSNVTYQGASGGQVRRTTPI